MAFLVLHIIIDRPLNYYLEALTLRIQLILASSFSFSWSPNRFCRFPTTKDTFISLFVDSETAAKNTRDCLHFTSATEGEWKLGGVGRGFANSDACVIFSTSTH